MNTKSLSTPVAAVIDGYLHFKLGSAVCSIPYFNNKTRLTRAGLRANVGKGSAGEILEEIRSIVIKAHISPEALSDGSLKKLLVDNNLGLDCSAFAFYILKAENKARGLGTLEKRIRLVNCHGLAGKIRCILRPIENCDVTTLADDANSRVIGLREATPGDLISMIGDSEENERDHILVISRIDYKDSMPAILYYCHAAAYPEDGAYGSGIKQGKIELTDRSESLSECTWSENGDLAKANRIFTRAMKSKTELRRLNWF